MVMPRSAATVPAALRLVLYVAGAALFVGVLSRGQAVVVPIALAAMVAFVLSPPVLALERTGLHRIASVAVVLAVALGLVGAFGYLLVSEFTDFATQMPQYATSIREKLDALRPKRDGALGRIEQTVNEIRNELDRGNPARPPATGGGLPAPASVQPVSVVPKQPSDVESLALILEPVLNPIAAAGIVLILTSFMLMGHEDLRNRVIRLAGAGRMTVTTRMLDEAGHRISRFLFTQSLINTGFGCCIALGLLLIGVPYALLWGVVAAVLRFVPYLGSLLALLLPAALAFIASPGWGPTLETLVLFLGLDALTAYLVEPVVIGTKTGVSSLSLLISAMFWTWLWGPVGLVLSTPLTVCLTAIGKHVSGLEFLSVVLGDEPPLEPQVTFYQRLFAGDDEEAATILDHELDAAPRADVFDRIVVPTLLRARRDQVRGDISPAEEQLIVDAVQSIVQHSAETPHREEHPREAGPARRMLSVPARNPADDVALEMLGQVLDAGWALERVSTATLASEVLAAVDRGAPDALCIAAVPPGGVGHIRYLCKRVHKDHPELPIWVLRPGVNADPLKAANRLAGDGAQQVATSFAGVPAQLSRLVFPQPADTSVATADSPPADENLARAGAHR
jgi:predicted PurR-regulated permease PerM